MSSDTSLLASPELVPDEKENRKFSQTNNCRLGLAPFGLEHIYDYEPGGHHPVHLHDLLGEGRYRVLHRLGNGGFANIWFCRDTAARESTKYVAVKIVMAESSSLDNPELRIQQIKNWQAAQQGEQNDTDFICLPLDQFMLHGPNGDHLCFVYLVLGPKV